MRFEHRFRVRAAVAEVAEFHRRAASMAAITPPPLIVRIQSAPAILQSGDRMAFTLWAGPLPVRWLASIEDVSTKGFTDRQIKGPFGSWEHRHRFERVDERTTDVVDQIEATYSKHPFWAVVGRLMWLGMPILFAFRGRRTQAHLQQT